MLERPEPTLPIRRISRWEHWRAVGVSWRNYPPGTDVLFDSMRAGGLLKRLFIRNIALPLYFARDEGWAIRGPRGAMAAIIYLRRKTTAGVRVLHIDDVVVDAGFRRQGLAQRLLAHAEAIARRESWPYLTLAVTVTNSPAVTLYRQSGFRELRLAYFEAERLDPATLNAAEAVPDAGDGLALRPLDPREATAVRDRVYRAELAVSNPDVVDALATYYAPRLNNTVWRYAIARAGRDIGYVEAIRRQRTWVLRYGLLPDLWGGPVDRAIMRRLLDRARESGATAASVFAMTPGHQAALAAGDPSLAARFGLVERSDGQMLMVKLLGANGAMATA